MKKRLIGVLICIVFCLAACGSTKDGDDKVYEEPVHDAEEVEEDTEGVNLMNLPENCELVPFEKFKEGFAVVCNASWEAPMPTYEEVAAGFGVEGVHYPNCDMTEDGISYKTYAWFSDEDWGSSKISVAIVFKAPEGSEEYAYWAYAAQGITAMDLE